MLSIGGWLFLVVDCCVACAVRRLSFVGRHVLCGDRCLLCGASCALCCVTFAVVCCVLFGCLVFGMCLLVGCRVPCGVP